MKNGPARFEFYFQKIDTLLQQASMELNPALYLYNNDARTTLFMLEALTRLYASLHNKKIFTQLNEDFKALEDSLGMIDYYDSYAKEFLVHPAVPVHIREYMQAQMREKVQHLNDVLLSRGWIGGAAVRLNKMRKKMQDVTWMKAKKEAKEIKKFYGEEIKEIKNFVKELDGNFTEMEAHVHELRRDLRWLSIYPQALQGMVQLKESEAPSVFLQKYLVPEIVQSKYNVMPAPGNNKWLLQFDKNAFYALSWMIAETGKLKDRGLQFFAVSEALQQTEKLIKEDAYQKSFEILGAEKDTVIKMLRYASEITRQFIKEKNLEKMVRKMVPTKKRVALKIRSTI
jgi:hypothetical protein